ncbi:MAG TPA: NAD(P)H-dependent oxidoreductase [Longimicrobiales bacterium]|nr:NAD(P)H-dependent oxidoreductase [Longimicrobiales bacterium]
MHDDYAVRVLILSASARSGSLNTRLAHLARRAVEEAGASAEVATIGDFATPFYNGDVEKDAGVPEGARRFADRLRAVNGVIIASPEYNASMPGELKNLIDWTSRLRPQPFNGRQAMLMSASPSMVGGNRALWSLRIPLEHLGMRVYPDMFSLAQAHKAFDDDHLADDTLQQRFERNIACFVELVEAATHYRTVKKQWVEFLGEQPDAATDRVETAEDAA